MTAAEVLARHVMCENAGHVECVECETSPWPCDAVDQARQLQEAQERAERLQDIFRREASASLIELAASEERVARLEAAVEEHLETCQSIYNERLALRAALAQPAGEPPTVPK